MNTSTQLARQLAAESPENAVFGRISPPPGVADYNLRDTTSGIPGGFGLILFISNAIRLFTIVGGLFVLFNVLYAGFIYLSSSGDTGAHQKVVNQVTFSIIGLLIMVGSYAIAALVGLIFFGDATFIINPEICGPKGC